MFPGKRGSSGSFLILPPSEPVGVSITTEARVTNVRFAEAEMCITPRASGRDAERADHEPPPVVAKLGWRYHHIGIPTEIARPRETHLQEFGLHVSGFSTSPFGIEWMRFDEGSPLHPVIRSVPHVAFEVDDLDQALQGFEVIYPPGSPSDGVRAAMILVDGAPVELIWFAK